MDALGLELGAALIAPAIAPDEQATRLILMPDDVLRLLPFAALRLANDANGEEDQYLIQRFSLSIADPALDIERPTVRQAPTHTAVVVAATGPLRIEDPAPPGTARSLELAPLPSARREAENVAEILGPDVLSLVDERASELRVKQAISSAPIIHFATHGVIDDRSPLDSFLTLGAADEPENGFLQAWEVIEQLDLDGALVTLSACETALGEDAGGEGILGLTRAFRLAGAANVVASLWTVRDLSTAELMTRYYTQLSSGRDPAHSLQQAQLALLRAPIPVATATATTFRQKLRRVLFGPPSIDYTHPHYWATFQVYGTSAAHRQ